MDSVDKADVSVEKKELPAEMVQEFVIAAHWNEDRVREMHASEPFLLHAVWDTTGETAIQAAAHTGHKAIAEYLLSQGALLEICTAAMLGRESDVARMLEKDPSLATAKGAHGITVMYHTALSGKPEIAKILIERGGGEGANHALHAATYFNHIEMLRWLLDNGAQDVNVLNHEEKTPLRVATEMGHSEIADMLRERGGTE